MIARLPLRGDGAAHAALGLATLLLIGAPLSDAAAQTPFALQNIGQPVWQSDARIAGRGGWGMTVADTLALGFENIAGLAHNPFVGIHFTGYGLVVDADDGDDQRTTSRTFAPDFRISAPIMPLRLALTAGYRALRATQYTTEAPGSWETDEGTVTGIEQFERRGTLFDVPIGASLRVNRRISVGASLNLVRGGVDQTRATFFTGLEQVVDDSTVVVPAPFLAAVEQQADTYEGTSYTLSVLLDEVGPLRLGASFTPAHDLDLERQVSIQGVARRYTETFELRMPAEYRVGAELRLGQRWRAGADYTLQPFSDFSGQPEWDDEMVDEWTLAMGLERMLGRERRGGTGNLPLRLGATVRRWGYRVGGAPVDERSVSVGTGFALEGGRGQLDLALTYGMIGDLDENGLESDYWRLMVSVTGLERWW
ncbi:MAG: hypothetical protein R6X25_13090 [Candidatus Krumholzibacteriia bacterium]